MCRPDIQPFSDMLLKSTLSFVNRVIFSDKLSKTYLPSVESSILRTNFSAPLSYPENQPFYGQTPENRSFVRKYGVSPDIHPKKRPALRKLSHFSRRTAH